MQLGYGSGKRCTMRRIYSIWRWRIHWTKQRRNSEVVCRFSDRIHSSHVIYLGALIFFFIEHCWRNDVVQEEQTINKICAAFSKMKKKEKQCISNFSEKMSQQLSCDCPEYLKEHEVLCDLNTKKFFKWCEYTM